MMTLTFYTLLILLLLACVVYFFLAKIRNAALAYFCLFWIPPVWFLFLYRFRASLVQAVSYDVIALLFLVVILSIIFGLHGSILVLHAHRRGEARIGLMTTTLLASLPAVLFAVGLIQRR
jgi:hypothetical protein